MSTAVLAKLLVLFLVVGAGWAVARLGLLGGRDAARALSNAAFYLFVPALLFRTTSRIDFAQLDPRVLLAFFAPVLAVVVAVYAVERLREPLPKHGPAAPAVRTITVVFGNTVQVGIPMAAALFGPTGLALHLTVVSLHSLVILTVMTALVETDLARVRRRAAPGGERLWRTLATTARATVIHPVVLPVLAGLGCNAAGVTVPPVADELLQLLGSAVVPLCLVLIGVSLATYGVRGSVRGAVVISVAKLVVVPLLTLVVARWGFGLAGLPLGVVVMLAALPVGSNALIFAQRYDTLQAETTAATVFSTLAFVAAAPLWLTVVAALG